MKVLGMKQVEISLYNSDSLAIGEDIHGTVKVNYDGRFDGVQVNTYILGSSEQVLFTEIEGKQVSLVTRLYVPRDSIPSNGVFDFTARVDKGSQEALKVRFRAAIIQEHKEVVSDTIFAQLLNKKSR